MEIKFLAGDSLGTRSMATLVDTADASILIDPRVTLSRQDMVFTLTESKWED